MKYYILLIMLILSPLAFLLHLLIALTFVPVVIITYAFNGILEGVEFMLTGDIFREFIKRTKETYQQIKEIDKE